MNICIFFTLVFGIIHLKNLLAYSLKTGGDHSPQLLIFSMAKKFAKRELEHYINNCFEKGSLKLKNRLVMEISLRDGKWLFTVDRFSDSVSGFDYYIPDTREQEAHIWELLTA